MTRKPQAFLFKTFPDFVNASPKFNLFAFFS
jgi:hypothetical protein